MSSWRTGSSEDLSENSSAAQRTFAMLLCARFFILEQLVQRFPANTNVMDARRRWVLAQVLPPWRNTEDLFVIVLRGLRRAEAETMLDITRESLRRIKAKRTDVFPEEAMTPFIVVIDEAQVAADCPKFFRSASGERRPILREMVGLFQSSRFFTKIILSGTGLSMGMVKKAVGSLSAKRVLGETQEVFTNVGRFSGEDSSQQEAYIRRYLTLSSNDISDKRLLERMKYWFSGRYVYYLALQDSFSSIIVTA